MSPIDDELRAALRGRADTMLPAADPLAGIERRASRMRRNRSLTAVAASALAVAAIAVAVPTFTGTSSTAPAPLATAPATPTAVALDSGRPAVLGADWDRPAIGDEDLDKAVRTAWGKAHGVPPSQVQGDQLFLGLTPAATPVAAYHLWAAGVPAHEVVAWSGPDFAEAVLVTDAEVQGPPNLAVGLVPGGDGGARFVVVAAARPGLSTISYLADGTTAVEVDLDSTAAVFARTGPTTAKDDLVQARFSDGSTASERVGARPSTPAVGVDPSNLVSWPLRGSLSDAPPIDTAKQAFAEGLGGKFEDLQFRPLLALNTDGGLKYVAGQAWLRGGKAHNVAYATGGECGPDPFVGAVTPEDATVLAFAPGCVPGRTTDTVFVVPQPQTGQVLYGAGRSEYRPFDFLPGLAPVVELERAPEAQRGTDMLKVLDGNGDEDNPHFEGSLQSLLCGIKTCS